MELLLLIILAHIIADFLLQSPLIAAAECLGRPRGYLLHFAGHLITLILLTHLYLSPVMAALWVFLPAVHLFLDWLKNRLFSPRHHAGALIFLLGQALHLLIMLFAWQWTDPPFNSHLASVYRGLLTPAGNLLLENIVNGGLQQILLTTVVYGFAIFGGAVLVRKVLDTEPLFLPDHAVSFGDTRRAGRCIGMLERAVVLSLTLANAFTAIAFVLTAKSIARYKELENREFAEYYLVGTLLSTLLAILGGLLLGNCKSF